MGEEYYGIKVRSLSPLRFTLASASIEDLLPLIDAR